MILCSTADGSRQPGSLDEVQRILWRSEQALLRSTLHYLRSREKLSDLRAVMF